jgi:hypothetical protein
MNILLASILSSGIFAQCFRDGNPLPGPLVYISFLHLRYDPKNRYDHLSNGIFFPPSRSKNGMLPEHLSSTTKSYNDEFTVCLSVFCSRVLTRV